MLLSLSQRYLGTLADFGQLVFGGRHKGHSANSVESRSIFYWRECANVGADAGLTDRSTPIDPRITLSAQPEIGGVTPRLIGALLLIIGLMTLVHMFVSWLVRSFILYLRSRSEWAGFP